MDRTQSSSLEAYIQSQMSKAKKRGKGTCTLFANNDEEMAEKLEQMGVSYITPRIGHYIVAV